MEIDILTCLMFIPELSKTAKSPNSCGNSSQSTAALTLIPATILSEKAAPIDKPSIKLCTPSPKIIIHATVAKNNFNNNFKSQNCVKLLEISN